MLERDKEMDNLWKENTVSNGDNYFLEDDDDFSFASFLEEEINQSMTEERSPSSVIISTSLRSTPTSIAATPEKSNLPRAVPKMTRVAHHVSDYEHLTQPAPPEVVRKLKTSRKRAPLDMTKATFPTKRRNFARDSGMAAKLETPRRTNPTLHTMRLILQPSFNKELFSLVSDYLEMFNEAAGNIAKNGNPNKISESKVQELVVTEMLSEACRSLHGGKQPQQPQQPNKLPKLNLISDTDGQSPMSRQGKTGRKSSPSSCKRSTG